MFQYNHPYLQHIFHHLNLFFCNEHLQVLKVHLQLEQYYLHNKHIVIYYILCLFQGHKQFFHIFGKFHASTNCISFHPITSSNSDLLLNFVFKLYHKTCEQFYRNFGIYEKSPNSFLPGLPHSIVNQFDFHNFLCLCLASVHLPHPFHLVSAFSFSVTPFRFASSGTISSMRFRAASSILAQYCLTYTQL